jgi:glycosyltransferase involved in cell wall biosynthesis
LRLYYSAADVFVTTPWYEAFGLTAVEAMACGTPVVAAAVGGLKYSVLHGRTGFLVPPNDPGALAERLRELCCSPRLAEQFATASVRRAHALFRWEGVAYALSRLYRQVEASSSDSHPIVVAPRRLPGFVTAMRSLYAPRSAVRSSSGTPTSSGRFASS